MACCIGILFYLVSLHVSLFIVFLLDLCSHLPIAAAHATILHHYQRRYQLVMLIMHRSLRLDGVS